MTEIRSTLSIARQAVDAVADGRSINDNPFPQGSDAHTHWRRVFMQCQAEGGLSTQGMVRPAGASRFAVRQEGADA